MEQSEKLWEFALKTITLKILESLLSLQMATWMTKSYIQFHYSELGFPTKDAGQVG
jgi:hypothetical protein